MKKLIVVMAGLLFMAFAFNAYALNVGYVDVEKAIKQYEGTKKLTDKLKKDVADEEATLEKETEDIKKTMDELDKKSSIMDKKELVKQKESLQQRYEKLKMKTLEVQQKLMAQQKEMYANLVDEINAIIAKIAKDKKYDYVFEKSLLLFGGEDITYLVIKEMNEK
jgi:Skp family chaperone for outer membrane proteins